MRSQEKISTLAGTIVLVIITVTVFSFVWVYEKTRLDPDQLLNNNKITIDTTRSITPENKILQEEGKYLQIYENKTYGYKLKHAPNAIIVPEPTDERVVIADVPDYRKNAIIVSSNAEGLSLDQVLDCTINSEKLDLRNIVITDVLIGQRHGKKLSIENSDYEYSTVIVFLNDKYVFTVLGNERGNGGENSFGFILSSFDFGDNFEIREKSFIDHSPYFLDQSGIYYLEQFGTLTPLEEVDRKTFQVIGNCAGGEMYFLPYSKDRNHIYIKGEAGENIDTTSFKYLGFFENYDGMPWGIAIAKDKNHIYYGCGKPVDFIKKRVSRFSTMDMRKIVRIFTI